MMDDRRKSDTAGVPEKSRNASTADAMEGRAVAKGNSPERHGLRTQSRAGTPSAVLAPYDRHVSPSTPAVASRFSAR